MALRSLTDRALPFFVVALCAALILPALFMDGMFMDGVFYASISRNSAEGLGTFWNPYFSDTYFPQMHEQPPLLFALQGIFFRISGDSIYTERIYTALTALACFVLLFRSWTLLVKTKNIATEIPEAASWLPLFFWIVMPVTFYAFTNNLEECTMTIFVLAAFNSILRGMQNENRSLLYWGVAGAWLLAAGLTKGIQGMFLLSAPFWAWVILRNGSGRDFVKRTLCIALVPVVFVLLVLVTPVMYDSFAAYFTSRFGKTFSGATAGNTHQLHLLFELLIDTLPVTGTMALLFFFGRKTRGLGAFLKANQRLILFLLACGFSGILPLLVTREQRGFYLVTALPFLALACAVSVAPVAARLTRFVQSKPRVSETLFTLSGVGLIIVLFATFMNAGNPKRDADKIAALHETAAITGGRILLRTSDSIGDDWPFIACAQRYHGFSVTSSSELDAEWFLCYDGEPAPEGFTPVPFQSAGFDLYHATFATHE